MSEEKQIPEHVCMDISNDNFFGIQGYSEGAK